MSANGRPVRPSRSEGAAIVIDGAEVHRMLLSSQRTLVRVETKVDGFIAAQERLNEARDKRLTAVERRSWATPSAAVLLGAGMFVLGVIQIVLMAKGG